jgi:hypothetical protein
LIGERDPDHAGPMVALKPSSLKRRKHEKNINEFPQWTAAIKDDDSSEYSIHFVGVFSKKKDAVPLVLLHGWPGTYKCSQNSAEHDIPPPPFIQARSSNSFR